ncbi:hypothetical protein GCM10011309_25040 [Litorimonas cladophorae]|uniref:Uncharacterized protein n=1 Tax=Litorimonas cladophorae TaxID=1220491 RepID=A0A918KS81_9PROT|nr:YiiX/YebB-like N1pC/P60 family cysteine hydrolase [Litorimonas cladophorae]GGX73910.1 hypothetical protein GCM10011309_25040 [Litorimonas cladophorae]
MIATTSELEHVKTPMFVSTPVVAETIHNHTQTLRACYLALPSLSELDVLMADAAAAEARGYYDPVEDERLRDAYTRYLAIRVSLWQIVQELHPSSHRAQFKPNQATDEDWRNFGIAFCAAEIIVRTGEYLIGLARTRNLVWEKLDEANLTYALPRKSFTRLYRQLTSAFQMHGFYRACETFDRNRAEILKKSDPYIQAVLTEQNLPTASRGDHLKRYRRFLRHSLKRRQNSALKNIVFSIFEMAGSDIADLKIPFVKPGRSLKRVTPEVIDALRPLLRPGDVFVTRHDDAMSNVFLPGFWPHSALWLGEPDLEVLEAKKDGVLFRELNETLQVDAFTVIRPRLPADEIASALTRAQKHAGKLYDFVFDFRTSDRLVCTEVVYRAYHGVGPINFNLIMEAGRHCLSAEALLNQGVGQEWFDVVAIYGVEDDQLHTGPEAKEMLSNSFDSAF